MTKTRISTHEEHGDGVRVSRRLALNGALALPALGLFGSAARRRPDEVEYFLARWTDATQSLVEAGDVNEEAHLHALCADLARLGGRPFPAREKVSYEGDGTKSGPVLAAMPFLVLQFDLEPGAVIRAHNHVGWGFVSMGVSGAARVRHFEPVTPDVPPSELGVDFDVREVQSVLLTPGATSSLTRTRANVHWFRAGDEGATFLDFGVQIGDPGEGPKTFSALDFEEEPLDAEARIHRARWIGNPYKKD